MRLTSLLLVVSMFGALATGCSKKDAEKEKARDDDASESDSKPASVDSIPEGKLITEEHGKTTVSWLVKPSGEVYGVVKQDGVAVAPEDVDGKVTTRALGDETQAPADKMLTAKTGMLRANVGELKAPITEFHYQLQVKKEPIEGVIHVPKAGTEALIDEGVVASKSKIKVGTKGPHGGIVQVVDGDVVEIVGQKGGGQIRVYVLDDDLKPIKIEKAKKIKLALYGDHSYWVDLHPGDDDGFYVGDVTLKTDPTQITVVIEDGAAVHCALVEYVPGHVIVVGPHAHVHVVYVAERWDIVVIDRPGFVVHKGKGKGHWKHGKGGGVHIDIH